MIIAYLLYAHYYSDPDHAKRYYAAMRTYNHKGLTIPSQLRYVEYFHCALQQQGGSPRTPAPTLMLTRMRLAPPPYVDRLEGLRFAVYCDRVLVYEHQSAPQMPAAGDIAAAKKQSQVALVARKGPSNTALPEPPKDDKVGKTIKCAVSGREVAAASPDWVVCSVCGGSVLAEFAPETSVPVLGSAGRKRRVCTTCLAKPEADIEAAVRALRARSFDSEAPPVAAAVEFALPGDGLAIAGDVRIDVLHPGLKKPLVHCWINTHFHTRPLVLHKLEIDGSNKDAKCKKVRARVCVCVVSWILSSTGRIFASFRRTFIGFSTCGPPPTAWPWWCLRAHSAVTPSTSVLPACCCARRRHRVCGATPTASWP